MPRVSRGAAVFIALVFTTAGISAVSVLSLFCSAATAEIGSEVPVIATLPGAPDYTVHLFAGTSQDGSTVVIIDGVRVWIPVSGVVFQAGTAILDAGSATIPAVIPNDPTLIGEQVTWVAVIIDNATGRVIALARTGGPIIEDAIC